MLSLNLYKIVFVIGRHDLQWLYIFAENETEAIEKLNDYRKNNSNIVIKSEDLVKVELIAEAGDIIV